MTLRNFSSTATSTTLVGGITASGTSVVVAATTGFPAAPFILALEPGTANQELILVTGVAGTTLTVTRGYDSTTGVSHNSGAVVEHTHAAIDFREANTHVNATSTVHGVVGDVVGTSTAQSLTNKTVALGSNTFSGTKAQFDTACTDADFASLAGTETLTNKTLTTPKIAQINDVATNLAATTHEGVASAVNHIRLVNSATGTAVSFGAGGSDTNVGLNMFSKGTGIVTINGVQAVDTTSTQNLTNKTVGGGTNISEAWASYSPSLVGWTLGNGTLTGDYMQIGKTVHVKIAYTVGSTDTQSGNPGFSFPVTPAAFDITNRQPIGIATIFDTSAGAFRHYPSAAFSTAQINVYNPDGSGLSPTVPWTWAAGDKIVISGTFEAA